MTLIKNVIEFIELLKGRKSTSEITAFEITEEIYLNGGCYRLYQILKQVFPEAEAYKVDYQSNKNRRDVDGNDFILSHVVTKIKDTYYDIQGEFSLANSCYKRMTKMEDSDHQVAEKFCYSFTQRAAMPC
ncbi:hypothetical protein ACFQZE_06320 [Paenibacillus sp. GCM10027627]|uniref:hypothetical protein n=1 Tax=unclassified Paenibacillus TaxID=185978 RepID=UPI00363AD654